MKYDSLEFSVRGKTLVAEWDNRQIPHSRFTTVFLLGFWLLWTPATAFVTYLFFTGQGPWLFFCFGLVFGYAGVVLIPLAWLLRYTNERIEIDDNLYQHYFVDFPWLLPKKWKADEITSITFGHHDEESVATLNVWCGRKRDMIAYWAKNEFREQLFDRINIHLGRIGSKILVININADPDEA